MNYTIGITCIICITIIACKFINFIGEDTYDYDKLSKRINNIEESLKEIKNGK